MDRKQSEGTRGQISEYAFHRHHRADEERPTRDLERRRVALERRDEERTRGTVTETRFQRASNPLRYTGRPPLHVPR